MSTENIGRAENAKYQPPTTGLVSFLPASWVPYAELMRVDRPGGFYALYVPCLFGVGYAVAMSPVQPSLALVVDRAITLLLCCLLARGAACTFNDAVDRDFDKQVARCQLRPIARGSVSVMRGQLWASIQTLAIIAILLRLPVACMRYFSGIVVLSTIYPFAKRFTNYPQFVLGSIFSMGFLTSVQSLNVDPLSKALLAPTASLFAANTVWTMIYDTIYAHQDVADDIHAGVKSMAVRFRDSTKLLTSLLACVMTTLLAMTGVFAKLGPLYYLLAVGGSAAGLAATISMVDLANPRSCGWWFNWGFLFIGGSILSGLAAESFGRSAAWSVEPVTNATWIHLDL
ncbi:4-hydroxybenzoate polyprenyl transferase [Penicillium lividum]|nr:4-hydroxybenzoate polyprenyl transferase [Penicillium lividum]